MVSARSYPPRGGRVSGSRDCTQIILEGQGTRCRGLSGLGAAGRPGAGPLHVEETLGLMSRSLSVVRTGISLEASQNNRGVMD